MSRVTGLAGAKDDSLKQKEAMVQEDTHPQTNVPVCQRSWDLGHVLVPVCSRAPGA